MSNDINELGDPILWKQRLGGVFAEVSGNKDTGYPVYTASVFSMPGLADISFEHRTADLADAILAATSALRGYLAGIGYSPEEIKEFVPA